MNERDSEIIEQMLAEQGYLTVSKAEDADLVLLNTCSIRAKAEQKVYSMLGQLRLEKEKRPSLRVGVIGCVAQQEGKRIFKRMKHVDLVAGTQQIYQIPAMLERLDLDPTKHEIATNLSSDFSIPPFQKLLLSKDSAVSPAPTDYKKFVTIMQGCNNYCAYCVVPETRGREISRPLDDILEEVTLLIDRGICEITLLGQNVNSYGQTNSVSSRETDFSDLLHSVSRIKGLKRLRFTTSNPKDLSDKLMRCFGEIDILCPHFHLPVQSGSNAVLKRMNRKYTSEMYLEKVNILKGYRPDIALATDIIVGFPGESDFDYQETMDLLNTVRFHGSFSFKYSDRPGTRSEQFDDKVPEDVKSERLKIFQSRQDQISLERNNEYVGSNLEVIVEKINDGSIQGRALTNHIVHFQPKGPSPEVGDIVFVVVENAGKHSLKGKLT